MEHSLSEVARLVAGVMSLLLVAALIQMVVRRIRLPFSVALVLVGMGLAALADHYPGKLALLGDIELSSDLVLYVFLPTLVFESAYNLDARLLRHNISAVLLLAVPGLLLSTALIGILLSLLTPIPLVPALLLGAILSATDPVAVIALFKKLGAPQRLTVLVEGESLFNDATALVLSRILVGVLLAGGLSWGEVGQGVVDFVLHFFGGYTVGWALARLTGTVLGWVRSDSFVEITLTTILAYGAFLIAEEALHLSGVLATMAAGLTLGGWGRVKVSSPVREYMEHFWEYLAFIANALVFLLVGLRVDPGALLEAAPLIAWTLLAMLISRASVVYGLMPLVGRMPGEQPVARNYQTVMVWGGLRGAIALAIVMSLPYFELRESFTAIVMGAVLFTLLVQGLTMQPLIHRLGLDHPPLADRLADAEVELESLRRALQQLPALVSGGLFSRPIASHLEGLYRERLEVAESEMSRLRSGELDRDQELRLLYLRAFAKERSVYNEMYSRGHLSEGAQRELSLVLDLQMDALRYHGRFEHVHSHRVRRFAEHKLYHLLLDRFALFAPLAEGLRQVRIARDYEELWGHYQGSEQVLDYLSELAELEGTPAELVEEVASRYRRWRQMAREKLDRSADLFPEFVAAMQERLGMRLLLLTQAETARERAEEGALPGPQAERIEERVYHQLENLRGQVARPIEMHPEELLRRTPLLHGLGRKEIAALVPRLHRLTRSEDELIVEQGSEGDSLFIIARGVVAVERPDETEHSLRLGTLMAGDIFGESSLLHGSPRNADVRCVSPCLLYELRREDMLELMEEHPDIRRLMERTEQARSSEN